MKVFSDKPIKINSLLLTKLKVSIICLAQLISFGSSAQTTTNIACDHAAKLKKGTLIVVLETKAKKLALLDKFSKDPKSSEKERSKYAKRLTKELNSRDTLWKYVSMGFGKLYDYSKTVFVMDTSLRRLLENPSKVTFYDRSLTKINHPITGDRYIAQYGHSFGTQSNNISDAWYIMTDKFERILSPFPGQIKYNIFFTGFFTKIPSSFLKENNVRSVRGKQKPLIFAFKLNKGLNKLYDNGPCR